MGNVTAIMDLNTSHVILYRSRMVWLKCVFTDLNTSHVILYRDDEQVYYYVQTFKYISCYSLSITITIKLAP